MRKAILKTLVYADIFDYPLTAKEIWRYLISEKKVKFEVIQKELPRVKKFVDSDGEYFFLKGRKKIVSIRKKRECWSKKKLEIAQRAAKWLRLIPTIKMVGVTGALAMKNAKEKDDIDFLIITAKKRLWLTRLLTVFLVEIVARRRRPNDANPRDKICLNMFLDEGNLAIPKNEQDLFSAHEVVQLKPLWEKDGIYKKFIKKNLWVKRFLPNWKP